MRGCVKTLQVFLSLSHARAQNALEIFSDFEYKQTEELWCLQPEAQRYRDGVKIVCRWEVKPTWTVLDILWPKYSQQLADQR